MPEIRKMNKFNRNMIISAVALVVVSLVALFVVKAIVPKDGNVAGTESNVAENTSASRVWDDANATTAPTTRGGEIDGSAVAPENNDTTANSDNGTTNGQSATAGNNTTAPAKRPATQTTKPKAEPTTSKKLNNALNNAGSSNSKLENDLKEEVDNATQEELNATDSILSSMETGAVFSYMYNDSGNFFYTEQNPWQREFGFNTLYDWAAPITVMYYDTIRVKFNYENLDWMIQMWKGQYGLVFVGSEIGVYTRNEKSQIDHYECADDDHLLPMEMTLYQDGVKLFSRKYAPHWWCTGFTYGHLTDFKFNDRSCLTVEARITFRSDEMAQLFAQGLAEAGFKNVSSISYKNAETFAVDGKDVLFVWRYTDQVLGREVD